MSAPIIIEWIVGQSIREQKAGFTRDISPGGAFVFCGVPPHLEASAKVEIMLSKRDGPHLKLHAEGRVARVEGDGGNRGFAFVGSLVIPGLKRCRASKGNHSESLEPKSQGPEETYQERVSDDHTVNEF